MSNTEHYFTQQQIMTSFINLGTYYTKKPTKSVSNALIRRGSDGKHECFNVGQDGRRYMFNAASNCWWVEDDR